MNKLSVSSIRSVRSDIVYLDVICIMVIIEKYKNIIELQLGMFNMFQVQNAN
jgi:hypothetical protein